MRHVVLRGARLRAESDLKTRCKAAEQPPGKRLRNQLVNYNVNARDGTAAVHRSRGIDGRADTDRDQDRYAARRQSRLGGFGGVNSLHFIADHSLRQLHYPGRVLSVQEAADCIQLLVGLFGRQRLRGWSVHALRNEAGAVRTAREWCIHVVHHPVLHRYRFVQRERAGHGCDRCRSTYLACTTAQVQEHHHPQQHREIHRRILDLRDRCRPLAFDLRESCWRNGTAQ